MIFACLVYAAAVYSIWALTRSNCWATIAAKATGLGLLAVTGTLGLGAKKAHGEERPVLLPKFEVFADVPLVKVADYRMLEKRAAAAAVTDGRYIYIIGGQSSTGWLLNSIERFDPVTGTSEPFARLQKARMWHEAVLHDGKIYVLGGVTNADLPAPNLGAVNDSVLLRGIDRSVEIVDLTTRQTSAGVEMPMPREQFGCETAGDDLYVIGGETWTPQRDLSLKDHGPTNSVRIFSFSTGQWRNGPPSHGLGKRARPMSTVHI